ncbi:gamma-glutamyl-gamma-aminobutyrate hydrolase family protein [Phenylobacterium sp.]|uniref:gamma-glutamyl-gamma-aminobutyrate hydrolase family protein n=1 Tax=Phenylobacterium sp. TaxID=1871053 RepID=UPI0035AFF0D9
MSRARIAVLLDENTSSGGTRYEAAKGYFDGLLSAGAAPYGVPYAPGIARETATEFDGLMTCGGRFAVPDAWYVGAAYPAPRTDRPDAERALLEGFLAAGKPVLGICAGMQALACLSGCRMTAHVEGHDDRAAVHPVQIASGSLLERLVGAQLMVNSFHREAIVELGPQVRACGRAPDGVIEAIELPDLSFALGLQWHQELLGPGHPGQAIFAGFVDACVRNT